MKTEEQIEFDSATLSALERGVDVLGNVLAEGARLISEGKISQDVIEEKNGAFALCLIEKDDDTVRELHKEQSLIVGRAAPSAPSDWQVADKWLSKTHFSITVDANGVPLLKDLASLNGTFVNDRAVSSSRTLVRGSCIRAGHSLFLFL